MLLLKPMPVTLLVVQGVLAVWSKTQSTWTRAAEPSSGLGGAITSSLFGPVSQRSAELPAGPATTPGHRHLSATCGWQNTLLMQQQMQQEMRHQLYIQLQICSVSHLSDQAVTTAQGGGREVALPPQGMCGRRLLAGEMAAGCGDESPAASWVYADTHSPIHRHFCGRVYNGVHGCYRDSTS